MTKYRNKIFNTSQLVRDMKHLLKHTAKCRNITVENIEVMPDHVHLLLSFKTKLTPTNIVRSLKENSARLFLKGYPGIRAKYCWGNHLRSRSYYMGTAGNMSRQTVKRYIDNQYKNSPYPNLDKDRQNDGIHSTLKSMDILPIFAKIR